ncbi:MAG: GNAT family N-acetyltransferase [Actinomycetota bacterium]
MPESIRRAEPGEGALLHDLATATFALACPPGTAAEAIEDFLSVQLSTERFEAFLADPDRELLVATSASRFCGYSMLIFGEPTDPDVAAVVTARPTVELSKFYLVAGAHGSGLAAELMAATVDIARLRGAATAWLGVNEHNPRANRFYEKNGFAIVGNKRFLLGSRWEDDYVRELQL